MSVPMVIGIDVLPLVAMAAQAAGATNVNGTSIDLAAVNGVNAVTFVCHLGALTASQVTNMRLQESSDNSTWVDIAGTTTANAADADGNKALISAVVRPRLRWVRCVVNRGTANAVINGVVAYVSGTRERPVAVVAASVSGSIRMSAPLA